MTGTDKQAVPEAKLSPRQLKSIPFLISCRTNEEARRKAGVSRQTLNRWLHSPDFQSELRGRRDAVAADALDRLKGSMLHATESLVGLLGTDNEHLRRHVANDVLRIGLRIRELETFEDRLTQLEQAVKSRQETW